MSVSDPEGSEYVFVASELRIESASTVLRAEPSAKPGPTIRAVRSKSLTEFLTTIYLLASSRHEVPSQRRIRTLSRPPTHEPFKDKPVPSARVTVFVPLRPTRTRA